jgi:hypothetical protein
MCEGLVDGTEFGAGDGVGATEPGGVHQVGCARGPVVKGGAERVGPACGIWDRRRRIDSYVRTPALSHCLRAYAPARMRPRLCFCAAPCAQHAAHRTLCACCMHGAAARRHMDKLRTSTSCARPEHTAAPLASLLARMQLMQVHEFGLGLSHLLGFWRPLCGLLARAKKACKLGCRARQPQPAPPVPRAHDVVTTTDGFELIG